MPSGSTTRRRAAAAIALGLHAGGVDLRDQPAVVAVDDEAREEIALGVDEPVGVGVLTRERGPERRRLAHAALEERGVDRLGGIQRQDTEREAVAALR